MTSSSILNIGEKIVFDESVESVEHHSYLPFNQSYNNNDEIRICINQQDLIVLPCESSLLIEGHIEKDATFTNNAIAFLFNDIRYELNGVEIDRNNNCGVASTMKGVSAYDKEMGNALENIGWNMGTIKEIDGDFSYIVPLSHLLGFAEDYRKVVVNCKHELILNRTNTNDNCAMVKDVLKQIKITISRVVWRMPIVKVSDGIKLNLMRYIDRNLSIPLAFRTWELYEYPTLPTSQKHLWNIKTSTHMEKPRFVIIGFQTARKNDKQKDMSCFDHCNLYNARLFLNSQYFPYESFSVDYEKGIYSTLYEAYSNFQHGYYGKNKSKPLLGPSHFKTKAPLVVIDCSRQNETYKSGVVDMKLELEFKKNVPANTTAYCLVISDKIFEYNALTNIVRKVN